MMAPHSGYPDPGNPGPILSAIDVITAYLALDKYQIQ